MGLYIKSEIIKNSIEALSKADVSSSNFFAYLLLKGFEVNHSEPDGTIKLSGKNLRDVIDEGALIGNGDNRYFNPLDSNRPYYSAKWWSNGPTDNIKNWAAKTTIVERIQDVSSVTIRVNDFEEETVKTFLKIKDANRVDIKDISVWWYRNCDLTSITDEETITYEILINDFISKLSLTQEECDSLFEEINNDRYSEVIPTEDSVANPTEYLPEESTDTIQKSVTVTKEYTIGGCEQLIDAVNNSGFIFSAVQIVTFLTAVRTKPFVILAGVSGTGKTHLPITVAECTGSEYLICSVKPDWEDSSELLGYTDIKGDFHPGILLDFCKRAIKDKDKEYFFILDEMNLARVEYYLSEVLSRIETMEPDERGRLRSKPLIETKDKKWSNIYIPANLCFVGSINMDESTNSISKKVLDRSFVLDFNSVNLLQTNTRKVDNIEYPTWNSIEWGADRQPLYGTCGLEQDEFIKVCTRLNDINTSLKACGFNFGFRLRNEILSFIANSKMFENLFSDMDYPSSSSFDIAIKTKVLSRIEGNSPVVSMMLQEIRDILLINDEGEKVSESQSGFKRTITKISEMVDMYNKTGYVTYWR